MLLLQCDALEARLEGTTHSQVAVRIAHSDKTYSLLACLPAGLRLCFAHFLDSSRLKSTELSNPVYFKTIEKST